MPVLAIPLSALPAAPEQSRSWCAQLEAGAILYFPQTPVPIPAADLHFLLSHQQTGSRLHKNIAYKPGPDLLSGLDRSASRDRVNRLHHIMRHYSASVAAFLADFLAPYDRRWRLDYASYRPIEEAGRDLPMRSRNDLLHTDAFPTRPTRGARILRFFHNIHPTRTRDWVVCEPFPKIVGHFVQPSTTASVLKGRDFSRAKNPFQSTRALASEGGCSGQSARASFSAATSAPQATSTPHPLSLPRPETSPTRALKQMVRATGLAGLIPSLKRSPYDEFMMRLHNTMKEDAEFQRTCPRESVQFAPGSSWMVYTETVPHAVLAGQYALEQTFLVDPAAMVTPDSAPLAVLEKMACARIA